MGYKELDIDVRYRSNIHDIPRDFYIPVLEKTVKYKRASGYFSTTSLLRITTGLFAMAQKPDSRIQLICSPELSREDIEAINMGYKKRDEVILEGLKNSLRDPVDIFEEDRLALVAELIASGMLDIRIAFMEDASGFNIYHEKIAVFEDEEGNRIAYTGSMNETENGFDENFESFYTFCSWKGQELQVATAESDFDEMWKDNTGKIKVVPFPDLIVEKLMSYKKSGINYRTDHIQYGVESMIKNSKFRVPDWIELRGYQDDAIKNWFADGCRGIYSLCTGAGKTITALAAMCRLGRICDDKLAVFVVCPQVHLVSQWEEDVVAWGWTPVVCHSKSPDKHWEDTLRRAYSRFKKDGRPFICLTTNQTFSGEKLQQYITRFTDEQNVLLIVDEAHNFGAESQIGVMPHNIRNRIALSATIVRHGDAAGTKALFDYFGRENIVYTLEDALNDKVLTPYEYHPVIVPLEPWELQKYNDLSKKIRKCIKYGTDGTKKLSTKGEMLAFERSRLIAGAEGKTEELMRLIVPYRDDNNILVYCGATSIENTATGEEERQINIITEQLVERYGMSVQKFTSEEDLKTRENIKKYFSTGQYQAITAIKCLDEGINIPGIKTAFILASTRNPKEFIQRRGRLLRKSRGKDKAVIYDFVTLPRPLDNVRPGDFDDDSALVKGEIARMYEFARLAENKYVGEKLINDIMFAYNVFFNPADLPEETGDE